MSAVDIPNIERLLPQILRVVCEARGYEIEAYSDDWIIRLTQNGMRRYVIGYHFDLNSASAALIARDKAAVSALLDADRVPHVEHRLFFAPRLAGYVASGGVWRAVKCFAAAHDFDLVCKPNEGTSGTDVMHVHRERELEEACQKLWARAMNACLSPYVSIDREYRVVLLDQAALLIYEKFVPTVVGDGVSTVAALIAAAVSASDWPLTSLRLDDGARLDAVVPSGVTMRLSWRHNLGRGAVPVDVGDQDLRARLSSLAGRALTAIGGRCMAVDIIESDGSLAVLEVNGGIMLENYARLAPGGRDVARAVYERILDVSFGTTT